jgi:hypothetical protein
MLPTVTGINILRSQIFAMNRTKHTRAESFNQFSDCDIVFFFAEAVDNRLFMLLTVTGMNILRSQIFALNQTKHTATDVINQFIHYTKVVFNFSSSNSWKKAKNVPNSYLH